jgi:hypothetical protein
LSLLFVCLFFPIKSYANFASDQPGIFHSPVSSSLVAGITDMLYTPSFAVYFSIEADM